MRRRTTRGTPTPASAAQSTPDAADKSVPTPPASPSQSPQNQSPAPPCIRPAQMNSNPLRGTRTSNPPAPPPAKPVPLPAHDREESGSTLPPDQSRARVAVRLHRNAKPHPTATGEMRRSFSRPARNRLPSKPPASPQTPTAGPPARSPPPSGSSGGNTRPPDADRVGASRSSTAHSCSSFVRTLREVEGPELDSHAILFLVPRGPRAPTLHQRRHRSEERCVGK